MKNEVIDAPEQEQYHCDHCDKMLALPESVTDPEEVTICPECANQGHTGGICAVCEREQNTALVVRRLSLVPEGAQKSALELIDEFALAAPEFTDGSEALVTAAEAFEVSDQIASQLADDIQDDLKAEIKKWDGRRLDVTRTLDDLKTYIISLIKDGIVNRQKAVQIYQTKISDYRRKVREQELAAQREAERLLAEERRRLEEEARKKEAKAQELKTAAARQRAAEEAQRLREQAEMVPESVAVPTSGPVTSASSVTESWDVEAVTDKSAYLRWLADHPEWQGVVNFQASEQKRIAKQFHAIGVPGLKFCQRSTFRSKGGK